MPRLAPVTKATRPSPSPPPRGPPPKVKGYAWQLREGPRGLEKEGPHGPPAAAAGDGAAAEGERDSGEAEAAFAA